MPAFWKIKRELKRLASQPREWPSDALSFLLGARYYDWFLAHKRRTLAGQQRAGPRRAVYLMFPVHGVQPSHLRSLRYLASKGVSVTIVSNLPLSETDQKAVLPLCHRCILRPNFGYDFGGYRDGVLSMVAETDTITQIVLLNDSVWFPITDATDWLDDVDAMNVDFCGAVSSFGLPRPDPEAFRDFRFEYRTDHRNFHYCSFALSMHEAVIRHPRFERFWRKFPLTNKKKRTVRRGEIGLTAWAMRNGFSHGETLGTGQLERQLATLDNERLHEIARNLIVPEDANLQRLKSEMITDPPRLTRSEATRFIFTTVARQGASYAMADFNLFERGLPFLKKSPLWLSQDSSDISLRLMDRLNTPAAIEAKAEAILLRDRLHGS